MSGLLFFQCFYIPLFEIIEVGGGYWFQFSYTDRLSASDSVMRSNLAWLIIASLFLLTKRLFSAMYQKKPKDHSSYIAIYRKCSAVAAESNESRKEELAKRAKAVDVRLQWVSFILSVANVIIIGIAHLEEGITAASATSQVPSWYIAVWSVVAHFVWNSDKLPETDGDNDNTV